jgi:hypothetical protein
MEERRCGGIPSASRHESRQHNRGKQWANRITNKSDGHNGAQRFVPFNRFPDTRISSLDRVGIQAFKNAGRKSRTSVGRKKGNKFRQIVDFRERNAILSQERFQIFFRALLCMETDGVSRHMGSGQIIVDIEKIMLGFFDPQTYDIRSLRRPGHRGSSLHAVQMRSRCRDVTVLHTILRRHHDQVLRNAHSGK